MTSQIPHRVFSYGTLRQENVQQALYGRKVETTDDALEGWRLDWVKITDPEVIAASGSHRHPILRKGDAQDKVIGAYLQLTDEELATTDAYEVEDYSRIMVTLASGVEAFVYVAAGQRA
jgi:gamma-glutamylcyclotransferase (GGCT)/AIG2-like uncharacterized protein YtfP